MDFYTLENDFIKIKVKLAGAELCSLVNKSTGREYLWQADPTYWGRTSPILFPFVGSLANHQFLYNGKIYPMSQHGFARDCEFTFLNSTEDTLWFQLKDNEDTFQKYPFHFTLEIGYQIDKQQITVMWRVINTDSKELPFSIGAHPAFMCPPDSNCSQQDCYLEFADAKEIAYGILTKDGVLGNETRLLKLNDSKYKIDSHLFDDDALIIEDRQANTVSLLDADKRPYVTVSFDAPLFGVWSPAGKNAPFVCIEPWYGRADSCDFEDELQDRKYGNIIKPNETFSKQYKITIA